jgi:hypothetical protein
MSASVLVAYTTRYGSTQEVAEAIAATLRERELAVDIQPDCALPGSGQLRHPGHWRAAEVDWLAGFWHCRPQPGRGSRDLRGERLHGSRGGRGDHLRRLVCIHQRRDGACIHWLASQRRHLDDACEADGRGANAA